MYKDNYDESLDKQNCEECNRKDDCPYQKIQQVHIDEVRYIDIRGTATEVWRFIVADGDVEDGYDTMCVTQTSPDSEEMVIYLEDGNAFTVEIPILKELIRKDHRSNVFVIQTIVDYLLINKSFDYTYLDLLDKALYLAMQELGYMAEELLEHGYVREEDNDDDDDDEDCGGRMFFPVGSNN